LCREKELPAYSKFRKIAFGSEYHDLPSFVEILASLAKQFPDLANDIRAYDRLSDDTNLEPTERERTQDALAEKIAAAIMDQPLTLSQLLDYPSPGLLAGLSLAIGRKGSPDDLYLLLGVADQALGQGSNFLNAKRNVLKALELFFSRPRLDSPLATRAEALLFKWEQIDADQKLIDAIRLACRKLQVQHTALDAGPVNWTYETTKRLGAQEILDRLVSSGVVSHFVVDDCIRMSRLAWNENTGMLPVTYTIPVGLDIAPTDRTPTSEQLVRSLDGFSPGVIEYLKAQLKETDQSQSEWKLGVAFVQAPIEVLNESFEIRVRPLAFRVTECFNRQIVRRRVALANSSSDLAPILGNLYETSANSILGRSDSFHFPCPSQLFVELALVSSDGYCLLVKKKSGPGVVAGIGKAWTCGPEYGLTLSHLVDGKYVRIGDAIESALKKEFGVYKESIARWHVEGIALQHVHLNSALYGYCELMLSGQELVKAFLENGSNQFHLTQADTPSYPELVKVGQLNVLLDNEERRYDGRLWHPSARIRLHTVINSPEIREGHRVS
jgi:hypothetical protein